MNFSMHLIVVMAAAYLCRADAAPDDRLVREAQRPTRTFKAGAGFMAARGFGKRNLASNRAEQRDLDKFWSRLESYQREGLENDEGTDEPQNSSIPSEWFIREMLNNPDFAQAVVLKFIDLNQDGMLSTDELLRNVKD